MVTIRDEQPADFAVVYQVHAAAFPAEDEARLVDVLRANGHLSVSLVAEDEGRIVGHVAFSPVTVGSIGCGLGLAPLAVIPGYQKQGIGNRLVHEGLASAARIGAGFVVVLGDPSYYSRFGFTRASLCGLSNEYGADEAFMVRELQP